MPELGKQSDEATRKRQGTAPGQQWEVADAEAGLRLDAFLAVAGRLGSRGRARWALERGKVFVNDADASPSDGGSRLAVGDRVRLWLDRPGSASARLRSAVRRDGELPIVYEDDALIVVNKPAGLLTVPLAARAEAASVADELRHYLRGQGKREPLVVHRIDRDTSGLVMFAKQPAAQLALKEQFERQEPERVYLAVVQGVPEPAAGTWHDWLTWDGDELVQVVSRPGDPRARESRSEYRVVEAFPAGPAALIEVRLISGKRNQIRVQAERHGHPLIGEQLYTAGVGTLDAHDLPPFHRQALHAWRLACRHPSTGRRIAFEAPLPVDLQELVEAIRETGPAGPRWQGRSPKKVLAKGTKPRRSSS